jgi:pimeloyl-ACP methyl ester carboxylesterase
MFNFRRDPPAAVDPGLMTPIELYANQSLWRRTYGRNRFTMPWQVKRYERTRLADGVTLYSANLGARTLIIGFCGRSARLFLPVAVFLQNLDEKAYDLLIASDVRHLHFDKGIPGFAETLPALADRLKRFADERGYSSTITYGISMGGLVALRVGEMIDGDRAISAGGRFAWHVGRLLRQEGHIGAFDTICACSVPSGRRHYAIYSENNAEDSENAARLAAIRPQWTAIPMPSDDHNFPHVIHKARKLDEYHAQIFDLSRAPDPEALRTLLA